MINISCFDIFVESKEISMYIFNRNSIENQINDKKPIK